VRPLADATLAHLQGVVDWPDLSATRYEPLEVLGRGGMGTVYRALDRDLQREVAVKVVRGREAGSEAAARLLREALVLARLEHPGLVPVHDAGRLPDGRAYYVMRFVRGTCLDAHLPALGPELGPRLRLFQRVCDAVAFAHAHGVVHRDLKPQNVMVGPFGEVLVMDWGVARVLDDRAPLASSGGEASSGAGTRAGTVLGTPGYMAPEQAAGRAALADERADVYALGALLHFLVAEAEPAGPGGPTLREQAARRGQPVSRPLMAVVARALAADPEERYARVTDLAADVDALLSAAPVSAYRENWLERGRRLLDKHRTPVLLVLAYLVMRMVLLWWWR
jgi:serine/threonine protein kinase